VFLGGKDNYPADRDAARQVIEAYPWIRDAARANRAFLGRAVRYLVDQGVRQFLDVGSGVPTVGNVHEIAQQLDPDARVVYVDVDPVAGAHAQQILAGNDRAAAVVADLRRPAELLDLLDKPERRAVLDLSRPVGLLMVSMLHFVAGEEAYPAVASLRDALAAGSYLVVSHPISEAIEETAAAKVEAVYRATTTPGGLRTRAGVERFFDGFDLVPPGLVWLPQWPGDPAALQREPELVANPGRIGMIAGVGQKAER
jgi:hypothetical protein